MMRIGSPEGEAALRELLARREASNDDALRVADEAIRGVRARGDAYVAEQIARFDGVIIPPEAIRIAPREVEVDPATARAIDIAIERVESFHRPQLPLSYRWTRNGSEIVHRVRPLRRAGCYVPGGRAVYLSTLIMTAVPARLAGVREIVVATTPAAAARDELHYTARRLGINEIYQSGGAAAIAAMALGTESLPRVDKIAGPGNAYVTAAKARLIGVVGIDMTAGPTELVVVADDTADPAIVIADLEAQAEHGEDSAVVCVTTSASLAAAMPPRAITFLAASIDEAVALANRIAPEHLSIQTRDPLRVAEQAEQCGAIFCGPASAVAAGDYIAGPNHVLPTAGSARFFSPLGVYDFVKRANVISLSDADLASVAPDAQRLAELEGLPMHARSIAQRFVSASFVDAPPDVGRASARHPGAKEQDS
jgi:histidinol dehydrogenase